MSLKFSLRSLLVLIALISVACAALANTGIWWHSIVVTATLSGMTGLVLWGTLRTGPERAFACGWLLFAMGYLAIVFGPWTGNHLGANLITTKSLAQIEFVALGNSPSPPVLPIVGNEYIDYSFNGVIDLNVAQPPTGNIWTTYPATSFNSGDINRGWSTNYSSFQSTGHWLLASVFGYGGAQLAAFLCFCRKPAKS